MIWPIKPQGAAFKKICKNGVLNSKYVNIYNMLTKLRCLSFCISDQQNFNVSVENMLTRCLDNERSWRLHNSMVDNEGTPLLIEDSMSLISEKKSDTLVFPCIFSALQWITQGRDSVLADPAKKVLVVKPSIQAKAAPLCDADEIHVLITGSLHLVGGVLKHLDPASSK